MKYVVLVASVVVQVCLGGLYAWSIFVPKLTEDYGLTTAETQMVFGMWIAVFTVMMVLSGRLLESRGPGFLLTLSGALFGLGYCIAAFSGGSFWLLFLGIGVVVGAATGLGYVCPLSACMKWFPDHRGMVTGVAVAGFGGGAVLLAGVAEPLLLAGVDVLTVFLGIGVVYGGAVLLAGRYVRFPSQGASEEAGQDVALEAGGTLGDPFLWGMICAMFAGTFAGLLVVGNLMPIALDAGIRPALAAVGISAFAIGNAAGRIAWGRLVDKWRVASVRASLLLLAASLGALWLLSSIGVFFIVVSFLVGFSFGACFVIHAALVACRYGVHRVGHIYPLIFLAYGAAGISGPVLGGWLYDLTGSYSPSVFLSIAVVGAGAALSHRLFRPSQDVVLADPTQASRSSRYSR